MHDHKIARRDFLAAGAAVAAGAVLSKPVLAAPKSDESDRLAIKTFDYRGVALKPSRWQDQFEKAREFYYEVPEDDVLHGWRAAAGLAAPGKPLGGWCQNNSNTVFGQWLQAMSRMSVGIGDDAMQRKAEQLFKEWSK